jgi:hypothetical protein
LSFSAYKRASTGASVCIWSLYGFQGKFVKWAESWHDLGAYPFGNANSHVLDGRFFGVGDQFLKPIPQHPLDAFRFPTLTARKIIKVAFIGFPTRQANQPKRDAFFWFSRLFSCRIFSWSSNSASSDIIK